MRSTGWKHKGDKEYFFMFAVVCLFMTSPVVLGFYGESGCGKTTLIVSLLEHFSKDYAVAAIKQSDKSLSLDTKGKDTWRFTEAGARMVVFSTPVETDLFIKESEDVFTIIHQLSLISQWDIILIEGTRHPVIPKVRLGRDSNRCDNTVCTFDGDPETVIAFLTGEVKKKRVEDTVHLRVNGTVIPLTSFPSTAIKNTVIGMIRSVHGVEEVVDVALSFRA
jgi:molybdopterin-guanine dinucleotide biosynthesis protein B